MSDVINELGWLNTDSLFRYQSIVLVNKMLATSEPQQFATCLVTRQSVHGRDTRYNDMLVTPTVRSESGRRRFLYSAVSGYNELPADLRALSQARFKPALREHLFDRERAT